MKETYIILETDGRVRQTEVEERMFNTIREQFESLDEADIQILHVSLASFKEKGFHNTNVDDIAAQIGIGKGTIYRHFGDKLSLFMSVLVYVFNGVANDAKQVESMGSLEEGVEYLIRHIKQSQEEGGALMRDLLTSANFLELKQKIFTESPIKEMFQYMMHIRDVAVNSLATLLKREQAAGTIAPDIDPYVTAYTMMLTIESLTRVYDFHLNLPDGMELANPFEARDPIGEMRTFIYRGLGYTKNAANAEVSR